MDPNNIATTALILRTDPLPVPPATRESAARPERAGDVLRVTIAVPQRQHAAAGRADQEPRERHERRDDRQPLAARDAEPEQHDVPRIGIALMTDLRSCSYA
jgi:hypothetical protein